MNHGKLQCIESKGTASKSNQMESMGILINNNYVIDIPFVLMSSVTLLNAGKNHFPDGSGGGSAIVGQLEILTLTHQPKTVSAICVQPV